MFKEKLSDIFNKIKNNKILTIGIFVSIGILTFALIFSTIFSLINMNNTSIIKGVKINDVNVSKLSKEEAKEKIENMIKEKIANNIKIEKDDYNSEISNEQIEILYNVDEAIESAYSVGRTGNIFSNNYSILGANIKGKNIIINISFNEEKLDGIIDEINAEIPGAMKENSYYIEEESLIITRGSDGYKINKSEIKDNIKKVLTQIENKENKVELVVEEAKVEDIDLEKIYNEIHKEAKDAYYTKDPFTIYPHVDGVDFAISMEDAKKILEEQKDEYVIPLKITKPNITTDKIGSEAFPDLLSTFTTKYDGGNVNRSTNLKIACGKINGTVVMPGETFSYNATLGKRSIEAGYREAKVYEGGKVVDGLGGGICQISSTLYNAVVLANLDIVQRKNHGFLTSYIGAGRDATVVYGAIDFKFKNTRKYPIRLTASASNGIAKISVYGIKEDPEYKIDIQTSVTETIPFNTTYIDDTSLEAGKEVVEQGGHNGCRSVTYKVTYLNGAVVSRKLLSSDTYNSMEKVIRRGVGAAVAPAVETNVENLASEQPQVTPTQPSVPVENTNTNTTPSENTNTNTTVNGL